MASPQEAGMDAMDDALAQLPLVTPRLRQQVLEAALMTAGHDHQMTVREFELMRAVADALDMPLPPVGVPIQSDS